MTSRLGVLGGMFDPVHKGHILAAEYAIRELALDKLKLIPCHQPNHRGAATASSAQRLAMLELVAAPRPAMEVDAIEVERGGVSYAVDTLRALRAAGRSDHIVFVMGMDSFRSLPSWHRWQELPRLCHVLAMGRPGDAPAPDPVVVPAGFGLVASANELFQEVVGNVLIAHDFAQDISSTRVRSLLAAGEDTGDFVEPDVLGYINSHNLYLETGTAA